MNGTGVFLKKYAWRGILAGMLTIILLRLGGADAAALAQNCGQWSIVPSPNAGSFSNSLYGITALSPNDVWAVGTASTATLTEHWNGTQWTVVKSPTIGTAYTVLYSVTAVSTNDVWAVGYTGSYPNYNYTALIEHWNGQQWKLVKSPNTAAQLSAVAAASPNNVWAVGAFSDLLQASTYHWDGTRWSNIANPTLPFSQFSAVATTSAGDFWAVGSYRPQQSPDQTLIEFYC